MALIGRWYYCKIAMSVYLSQKVFLDHISWYFALNHQNHHFDFVSVGYVAVSRKLFAYLIYSILLTKK